MGNLDVPIAYKTEWSIAPTEGFKKFYDGLCEYLKSKLTLINSDTSGEHYSCGHDDLVATRPKGWRRFRYLQEYCAQEKLEWITCLDIMEEKFGRKIKCDCSIINNEEALRKTRLKGFGFDVNQPGI